MTHELAPFFHPRSVAVVGASSSPEKVGYALLRNLLFGQMRGSENRDAGFRGPIYAVNPKGGEILGQKVFPSLGAIGEPVDLMVVAIPPKFIPGLMTEAHQAGVTHGIIISAGFAEMGAEGKALQDQMLASAQAAGIRLIGPNCLGVLRPGTALNASFAESMPPRGRIGVLSQSGALITGLISFAQRERFGLSAAVSLGSKADVEDEDVLRFFKSDDDTGAVALYVEAFTEPRKFYDVAAELAQHKPVVALKGGATAAGARAASSHTGSLAGSLAAYHAAFSQAGVVQAANIRELVGWSRALAAQPPAPGRRLAIVTNAGGPGVVSADVADRFGMQLAQLSAETMAQLNAVLPSVWSRNNPVDVIGDATPKRYQDALNILGRAPEVDGIVVLMTVQAMTNPRETAEAIAAAHEEPSWKKPLVCSFIGLIGTEVGQYLDERGVPEFNFPEEAVSAMGVLMRRGEWLALADPPPTTATLPEPDLGRAAELLAAARETGQRNLDLARARDVLASAGIRYNQSGTARDEDEAVALAERLGFPVVVKVVSPDVLHKSDVGGVVLHVIDAQGVRDACASIRERVGAHQPDARIDGFTIEQHVAGTEIIVGMSRDPDFGPLLMVGMGGIFVEVYKDVSFGLVPLSPRHAQKMISEIRAQPLLNGARERPPLDRSELAEVLLRVSRLVEACDDIDELDINPLVITDNGLVAIDARVIAKE